MQRLQYVFLACIICIFFIGWARADNWRIEQLYSELDQFESQRGAFLPEEQVLRVARLLEGCTDADIRSLVAIQRPKNQLSAFGRTDPATPGECHQYPSNTWARIICDGATGTLTSTPGGRSFGPQVNQAALNYDQFLKEKETFEKRRMAFMPVDQALQAARCFPGWDQNKLQTLETTQNALTYYWTGSGPTVPVDRDECMRYPEGSWPRVIAEASLGVRAQVQPGMAASESPPKLWPKNPQWVKDALTPSPKVKVEPAWQMPPRGVAVYCFICQERPHLYWSIPQNGFARLTRNPVFRSPKSICQGPGNTLYVMDFPTYKNDNAILWQVDLSGSAKVVLSLDPQARENQKISQANQIIYHGNRIYVSGAIKGILGILPDGGIEHLLGVEEFTGNRWQARFGGVAIRGEQLFLAHGFATLTQQKSYSPISFDSRLAPAAIRVTTIGNRNTTVVATDQQAGLFNPHSMAITSDGTIYITDRGVAIGEQACLQMVQGSRITPLKIKIGNRGPRWPCGMIADSDDSLVIADPYMWSPQGASGTIIRYVPRTHQCTYLFLGQGDYNPLGVVRLSY